MYHPSQVINRGGLHEFVGMDDLGIRSLLTTFLLTLSNDFAIFRVQPQEGPGISVDLSVPLHLNN